MKKDLTSETFRKKLNAAYYIGGNFENFFSIQMKFLYEFYTRIFIHLKSEYNITRLQEDIHHSLSQGMFLLQTSIAHRMLCADTLYFTPLFLIQCGMFRRRFLKIISN